MKDLESRLAKRTEEGLRRELRSYEGFIDFLSNDYLGFAKETESVIQSGSTGSRLKLIALSHQKQERPNL